MKSIFKNLYFGSRNNESIFIMNRIKTIGLTVLTIALTTAFTLSIDLETKSLLNDKVELKIPKDFEIMSEEMMKLKYPSENRPTLVYSNESGGINVALSLTENKATPKLIAAYKDNFVKAFKNVYPSAEWKDSGVKTINGKEVGYVELITPALDTEIYNLMFFTDMDGKLLFCTFNCIKESLDEWSPTAKEIMNSLKTK